MKSIQYPLLGLFVSLLVLGQARAGVAPGIEFDIELTELTLTGGPFPIPLASDPSNELGDSVEGYGFVDSFFDITLSSQRPVSPGPASTGSVIAYPDDFFDPDLDAGLINPEALDGQPFFVDSFFDVFFDITVTDVDNRTGRDYAGQPDGATLGLIDNGPAFLDSFYEATFDKNAANFGLFPPPGADPALGFDPAFGFIDFEIPLGADINGNGENDKIKFQIGIFSFLDENRTFITLPNGDVVNMFDTAAFLEGAIVDESTDPPFTIGAQLPNFLPDPSVFGGPTTATSTLLTQVIPIPAAVWLFGSGLLGLIGVARSKARV